MGETIVSSAIRLLIFLPFALVASMAIAQGEKPAAHYWMSVETRNMTIPGMSAQDMAMMGAMRGGNMPGVGPGRSILLQLSAPGQQPSPNATHDIPPGQNMGQTLPLLVPERAGGGGPTEYEQPKVEGRMIIYWGCGDTVRQGQPIIINFADLGTGAGKMPPSHVGALPQPPGPGRDRTYGTWPYDRNSIPVPRDSSLVGDHFVHGNYPPEIKFAVDNRHDFMAPVVFSNVSGATTDAIRFQWDPVPTAIGYFASAFGVVESNKDFIAWSSSELAEIGGNLLTFLPPAQVQRLIQDKVVMPTQTTQCTIPQGIFRETRGASLQFIAYGDELNFVHPPRPADPKIRWDPIWYAKVRLKSTGMLVLGAEGSGRGRAGRQPPPEARQPAEARQPSGEQPPPPAKREPIPGQRILKGILGL
jgi:hypothetical protein